MRAVIPSGTFTMASLPSSAQDFAYCTICVNKINWVSMPYADGFAWFAENTRDRFINSWDISATDSDNVTAYLCHNENTGDDYALYIGGAGAMKADYYTFEAPPPWGNVNGIDARTKLSRLYMTDGITNLCERAAANSSGLSCISLPDTVQRLGHTLFTHSSFNSFIFPTECSSVGMYAFAYNQNLSNVRLSDRITALPCRVFFNCTSLRSLYIPSSVTSIPCLLNDSDEYPPNGAFSPFADCSENLTLYVPWKNSSSLPAGWNEYWHYRSSSSALTVRWNYTREQYEAEISQ